MDAWKQKAAWSPKCLVVISNKYDWGKWTKTCETTAPRLSLYERWCVLSLECVRVSTEGIIYPAAQRQKTTCCQYWWFVLRYLCGLGSEVMSHRQSGVNGACVTLDKRLRALEQSQGRHPVCAAVDVLECLCVLLQYPDCLVSLNLSHCNRINSCLFLSVWPCWWSLYPHDCKPHQKKKSHLFHF